jgi:hypothetical protein
MTKTTQDKEVIADRNRATHTCKCKRTLWLKGTKGWSFWADDRWVSVKYAPTDIEKIKKCAKCGAPLVPCQRCDDYGDYCGWCDNTGWICQNFC